MAIPILADKIKTIAIFRNDRFGEFLLNIPAFRALKQTFLEARLIAIVDPYVEELARAVELIDETIAWENRRHSPLEVFRFARGLKNKKIDLCVIFNPSKEANIISFLAGIPIRLGYNRKYPFLLTHKIEDKKYLGLKHEVEYNLELVDFIGARTKDKSLSLKIEDRLGDTLLAKYGVMEGEDLLAVHPFTSDPRKQWPRKNFVVLAKRLTQELSKKVIILGKNDLSLKASQPFAGLDKDILDLTGKTTLLELAALLKKCRILVSGDSGPLHLASCVGTPVIAIFRNDLPGKGPTRWGPFSVRVAVLENHNLSAITVHDVFENVKRFLT